MLQEQTIKKITDVILPLVKLEIFTPQEVEDLQRVNDMPASAMSADAKAPEKIPELYTLQETAKILKMTVKSVYDFIKEGKLGLIKLGGRTSRISGDDILRLIQSSRIPHEKTEKTQDQS
jgi:excisionase family DNA binding protein